MIYTYCGDCIDFMNLRAKDEFDACITDFPYDITQARWDDKTDLAAWILSINSVTKNKLLITTSNQPFTTDLINANRRFWKDELVWDKIKSSGPLNSKRRPLRQHETIQIFYEKQPHYTPQMRYGFTPYKQTSKAKNTSSLYGKQSEFTVQSEHGERYPTTIIPIPKERNFHPTAKPVALYEWLILSYTRPGDTILEPFAGSGTTGRAAHRTGRNCYVVERDRTFYDQMLELFRMESIPFTEIAATEGVAYGQHSEVLR